MTKLNEDNVIAPVEFIHGCRDCGEVLKGYTELEDGYRLCHECGGRVLSLQEAFDLIRELEWRIEELTFE